MMKILYSIPWNTEKNIGVYYNDVCNRLRENEFACFIDGDAVFTTKFFGKQLEDIISKYPECGLFTCPASKMGCVWQRVENLQNSEDMGYHREIGKRLFIEKYDNITDVSDVDRLHVLGGVLILISKKIWRKLGGFKTEGILGIDNDIHWRAMDAGEKVYLMNGVYLYHWYRGGNESDKGHLL